jgi:YtkA-like protein
MRPALIPAVLVVMLAVAGCGGKKKGSVFSTVGKCPPVAAAASAGNAQIKAQALGGRYAKLIVIHAKEKSNGAPIHGGDVTIQATMACPDVMHLYEKKLQETAPGTYKTGYTLVMPGQWTFSVVLRAKNGDATTGTFPVTVKTSGT